DGVSGAPGTACSIQAVASPERGWIRQLAVPDAEVPEARSERSAIDSLRDQADIARAPPTIGAGDGPLAVDPAFQVVAAGEEKERVPLSWRPDRRGAVVLVLGDDLHLVEHAIRLDMDVPVVRIEAEPVRADVPMVFVRLLAHLDGHAAGVAELAARLDHPHAVAEGEPPDPATDPVVTQHILAAVQVQDEAVILVAAEADLGLVLIASDPFAERPIRAGGQRVEVRARRRE